MFQCTFEVPDEPFRLVAVSDLHIGLDSFREDLWEKQLQELDEPNTFWISLGDIVEGRVGSDVRMYDPVKATMFLQQQYQYFTDSIAPYKEQCVGMIRGNHEVGHIKRNAYDPLDVYCAENNIPYFGDLARITLKNKTNRSRLLAFHGAGGGRQIGSAINRINGYSKNFLADVVISGHHHKPAHVISTQPIEVYNEATGEIGLEFVRRDEILTGSLMDGYIDGASGGYGEQKLLDPYVCSYSVIQFDETATVDHVKFITG